MALESNSPLMQAARLARHEMNLAAETWSDALGRPITVGSPKAKQLTADQLGRVLRGRQICATLDLSGHWEGESFLLLAEPDALTMTALFAMQPPEKVEVTRRGRFRMDDIDALTELLNHLSGAARAYLNEQIGVPLAMATGSIVAINPADERALENAIGGETLLGVRFPFEIEGFPATHLLRLYPESVIAGGAPTAVGSETTILVNRGYAEDEDAEQTAPAPRGVRPQSMERRKTPQAPAPADPPQQQSEAQTPSAAAEASQQPDDAPADAEPPRVESLRDLAAALARSAPAEPQQQPGGPQPDLARVLDIRLPVRVRVARKCMTLGQVLDLSAGAVISFDKPARGHLDLMAGQKTIAQGRAVVKGDRFAIQVARLSENKNGSDGRT
jgi:flagellar motor switch/type III secretory pathway protein FliN